MRIITNIFSKKLLSATNWYLIPHSALSSALYVTPAPSLNELWFTI